MHTYVRAATVRCGLMCYESDARPSAPPRATGAATGADLVLTASDGNRFAAYLATPENPTGAKAVLMPDANGLSPFARDMAMRFAETGTASLAIGYFGRTAGASPRGEGFEPLPHLAEIRRETVLRDATAAVDYVRKSGPGPVFALGLCMGGGFALYAGTADLELAGVIAFYPWTGEIGKDPSLPPDFAEGIRCPVLGLFGDADQAIPVEEPRSLNEQMDNAGVQNEVVIYPGEPHGYFELHHMGEADHQAAAADSWQRLLGFIDSNSG